MGFAAQQTQRKKITHAVAVAFFTVATAVTAAIWSVWVGVLGVIGFSVLILTLLKPSWFFTAIYPPFIMLGQVPVTIGDVTISLERALVIVGGIGLVGGVLVTKRLRPHPVSKSVFFGILLLIGTYLVALLLFPSEDGQIMVLGLLQKIVLGYFVYISFRDPKELYTVFRLFLAASFVASLATLWVFYTEGSLATIRAGSYAVDELMDIETALSRGFARTGAGNTMALWAAIAMLWQTTKRESRTFWIVAILWFSLLSLFALRRETLVTIAGGLVWLIWRHPGRYRRYTLLLCFLMVSGLVIFVLMSPEWMDRLMGETVDQLSTGEETRTRLLFRFTPAAIAHSPLIGFGPGNYQETQLLFPHTVSPGMIYVGGVAPHNSWSAVVVEAGIGALIGFCLLLWGVGRPLYSYPGITDTKFLALWSIAPLIFLQLLMSLFFGDALKQSVTWFWLGILLALERMSEQARSGT